MFTLSTPWPLTRRGWLLAIPAAVALIVGISFLDRTLSAWAQGLPESIRDFFQLVTLFGLSDWILIPSLLAAVILAIASRLPFRWSMRLALRQLLSVCGFIFVGVAVPGLVSNLLKRAVGRARPELFDQVGSLDFHALAGQYVYESFPSGHATTAFAFCFVVAFLAPRALWDMLLLSGLIAISRVVVGAHYPTDIVGGMMLGTMGAYAMRYLFAARGWAFRMRPNGHIEPRRLSALRRVFRRSRCGQPRASA